MFCLAVEKMRLLGISSKPDHVLKMIEQVLGTEHFHPELASHVTNEDNGGLIYPSDRIYQSFLSRCERIMADLDLHLDDEFNREYNLEEIESAISEAEKRYNTLHSHQSGSTLDADDKTALKILKEYPIENLDEGFVSLRFGRVPIQSLSKLLLHADERFVFTQLHRNKQYAWIAAISMNEDDPKILKILDSLYFESIGIPIVNEDLLNHEAYELLDHVYGFVKKQSKQEAFLKYVGLYGEQALIVGFVREEYLDTFKSKFSEEIKVNDYPADAELNLLPPTKLKNGWFSRPFSIFIEMYGLPKYGDFDPTAFFAVTYSLLFGLMFGDLGQGLVIALLGLFLEKKKDMQLGAVAFRIGLFSMFFGTIYGSFFGNETFLLPLLKPLGLPLEVASSDFTMTLLISAVGMGVVLILMSIGLNIVLSLKKKDYPKALLSQNGLAGFVLYGFVMAALTLSMMFDIQIMNVFTIVLFIVIPMAVILFHEPLRNIMHKKHVNPEEGWGSYLTEGIFELIEVVLSFVTNTMSFLRVGGFVLSHAGMMTVVMTLNKMTGSYGIIVMIIGNIIVIALEGLIVGIQSLRLEYYEMFSRYYDGGGKKFKSV